MSGKDSSDETQSLVNSTNPLQGPKYHQQEQKYTQPQRIGPFKILETLGEGGMGVVYLAEQEKPIHRRVALKIVKLGMDTKQVIARFETEREALALMNHPNVARVFDAGATEQGRPYFVMEYVQGIPITDYCDTHRLTTEARLKLFMDVCHAVQHAHQKGIIHRDIKPTNVLVTVQDDKPVAKVIDFGVAKAAQQRLTERTLFTEQGQLIGTPGYMSPEQAEMTALDIDTRTDIYSLGVLLYEILVGTRPFDEQLLRNAGLAEIQRIIRQLDPPKPSTRLSALGSVPRVSTSGSEAPADPKSPLPHDRGSEIDTIAHRRHTEPKALIRQIRGDLDWITMKALEKDRTRRYATALEFADDLGRYLGNQPVLASPPTAVYRFKKLLRRNRALTAGVLAVTLALSAGLIVSTSLYVKARNEKDKAQAVTDFLRSMLDSIEPEKAHGRDVTVREVLDEASKTVNTRLEGKPEIQAPLHETIGRTYYKLGLWASSKEHYEWLVRRYRATYGTGHPKTLWMMYELGINYFLLQDMDAALTTFQETLAEAQRALGEENHLTISTMSWLGNVYTNLGDFFHARDPVLRACELVKRTAVDKSWTPVSCLWHRATFYHASGAYRDAVVDYLEVIELATRSRGDSYLWTLRTRNELGWVYRNMADAERCKLAAAETLARCRKALGEGHPETIHALTSLAWASGAQVDFHTAESLFVDALARSRRLSDNHTVTRWQLVELASFLERQARFSEAETQLAEVVRIANESLQQDNQTTASAYEMLQRLARSQGDEDRAAHYETSWIAILKRRAQAPEAPKSDLNNYARAVLNLKPVDRLNAAEALRLAQRAEQHSNGKDPQVLDTLALAYETNGTLEAAIDVQNRAVALASTTFLPFRYDLEARLIDMLRRAGKPDLAIEAFQRVERDFLTELQARRSKFPPAPLDVASALFYLGMLLVDQDKYSEAEPLLRECLAIQRAEASDRRSIGNVAFLLACCLLRDSRYDAAEALLFEAQGLKRFEHLPSYDTSAVGLSPEVFAVRSFTKYLEAAALDDVVKFRSHIPPECPQVASALTCLGMALMAQSRHPGAEPILREALALREAVTTPDPWMVANGMSLLGASLAGQQKFEGAESLLVESCQILLRHPSASVADKRESLERVVRLYKSWDASEPGKDYDTKAAQYRALLAADPTP